MAALTPALYILFALAVLLAWPAAALAQQAPALQGQVTDQTARQVLADGRGQIGPALDDLRQRQNIQLFVLFVDSTAGLPVTAFADETARRNSLGGNDALLVVSLGDRTDALWRGAQSLDRLTDRELNEVLTRRVEPLLGQGDFTGAVIAGASGLASVAGEGELSAAPGAEAPGLNLVPLLVVGLLGGGGVWLFATMRRRGTQQRAAQAQAQTAQERAHEANGLLIRGDEGLREAKQELQFAEAQFGEADVAPYREAIGQAEGELQASFTLRQQLDDDVPETLEEHGRLVEQIIERASAAQRLLDEHGKRLEELRDLERRAPEILAGLPPRLDQLDAQVSEAEQTLASLDRYAAPSWASVTGNIAEARKRLAYSRAQVSLGQQATGAGDTAGVAAAARGAQRATEEAARLLEAITALAQSIQHAEEAAPGLLAEASSDITTARAALTQVSPNGLAGRLAEAEAALEQAHRQFAAPKPDVLAAHRLATQADVTADEVLAQAKQEEDRRAKEEQVLAAQLQAAETSYYRAADYIGPRHSGVGREPRTRLVEAERHLTRARALAGQDNRMAIEEARQATARADEAYALAQQDFDSYDRRGPGASWGGFGGLPIPIPIPSGGGWGGGGWGGTPWGSFGGDGGGFGGGGSVGGGWGGGGGGSVGGRW